MGQPSRAVRVVEFVKSFHLGGTEVQVVELLRGLSPRFRLRVGVTLAQGPLLEDVARMGHLPETFSLAGSYAHPNTVWQMGRLVHWLRQQRAEVVHVQDLYATLLAAPAAKMAGCRLVVSRLDLAHFHTKVQRALLSSFTRMADQVVVNAKAIETMLVNEEGIVRNRIRVIPNGLDLARFDARAQAGLLSSLPALGRWPVGVHVANMNHPVKRHEDLMNAVALLKHRGTNVSMLLVGDGPRRPMLEELSTALGIADRFHFLGHRKDVPALYSRAAFGVLCSEAEGLSNAVMEGMAAGLPMVVTDVGGNPDLIENGIRGWVVPKNQPEALAQVIAELLASPQEARSRGEAARRFVERELTVEKLCRSHEMLYCDLAGRAAREEIPPAFHGSAAFL